MRVRPLPGLLCVAAVSLASATAVTAGAQSSAPEKTVRLAVGRPAYRAGRSVPITIVNSSPSLIVRGLCFTLERRRGNRWVAVTRTHGILVPCPTGIGLPQPAGTRRPLDVALYDDLVPGVYRIILRYKSVHPLGRDLENLKGAGVRSVQAQFSVLAFRPGPEPNLTAKHILALAEKVAASSGDRTPSLIQHAEGSRFEAVVVSAGGLVFAWNWSYLIAIRGHFTFNDAPVPSGAKQPSGRVITLVVDARTGQGTDSGIGNRYPRLMKLGVVTTDLGPTT